jgi:hypothetical protein
MGKLSAGIMKHNKAIGMGMTAMGGAILAGGILSIKSFAEMGDEVQKMALKTGFSTEALSEFRHVAEISGASLQSLDKAVKRMSKALIDADRGLETYKRSFDELGLSTEALLAMTPEEQFETIAMALADMEDPTRKAAIAQEVFGRAGTELLPMLASGAAGIAELKQEAHELGIVFDQEAANKAAKFNDDMKRMERSMDGVKMKIANVLLPALTPLIENITRIIKGIGDWMKEHPALAKMIMIAVGAIGALLVILGPLMIILPGIIAALPILAGLFAALTGPIGIAIVAIAALIAVGVAIWKNWDTISAKAREIWGAISNFFAETMDKIKGIFSRAWDKIKDVTSGAFDKIKEAMIAPIKGAVNAIISMVNWMIRQLNKIRIDIPSWVPGIGGKGFGINIPELPKWMAEGGIVTRPTLAVIGERGPEAVIPLRGRGVGGFGTAIIPIYLDGQEIARYSVDLLSQEVKLQGAIA